MPTPQPGRRSRWLIVVIVTVVVAVGGGFLAWRAVTDPLPAATAAAQRAADALAARSIGDGSFGSSVGPAELDDLAATLRGMGTLRPTVTVESVQLRDDGREGTARLRAEWVIHAGKPAWIQDAYLRLVRGADGWTGVWDRDLIASGLAVDDRLRAVRLAPTRGEILGAGDERLVWNADAKRIGLDKTLIAADAQPRAASRLAKAVGIDVDAYVAKVAAYGPKAYVEATVIRAVGSADWRTLTAARAVEGVRVFDTVRPLALSPTFARQLLGSVGEATADLIDHSDGTIRAGDLVGLGGLQRVHNAELMGVTGFVVQSYPKDHPEDPTELFRVDSVPGSSLRLTLDAGLQQRAEALVNRSSGRSAAVLVRPSDGAILALASRPGATTATTQRVYPDDFAPVSAVAGDGDTAGALRLLGVTEPFGLGVDTFGAELEGGTLRLSPLSMAVATASVARGSTVVPALLADETSTQAAESITPAQAERARRAMVERAGSTVLAGLRKATGARLPADGDGKFWTVAVRGDLVVVGYDSDKGSVALTAALLRAAG